MSNQRFQTTKLGKKKHKFGKGNGGYGTLKDQEVTPLAFTAIELPEEPIGDPIVEEVLDEGVEEVSEEVVETEMSEEDFQSQDDITTEEEGQGDLEEEIIEEPIAEDFSEEPAEDAEEVAVEEFTEEPIEELAEEFEEEPVEDNSSEISAAVYLTVDGETDLSDYSESVTEEIEEEDEPTTETIDEVDTEPVEEVEEIIEEPVEEANEEVAEEIEEVVEEPKISQEELIRLAVEEALRKRDEEDRIRRLEAEEKRLREEEERNRRLAEEAEARRIQAVEEQKMQAELEEQRRLQELENIRQRRELEEALKAQQEALLKKERELEEMKRQAEEEARRLAEEEARRLAEEEARRLAEEEARRLAEEEARRLAEEEARRQAEEEARRQAEEEARRQAEEEARRQAEEEARRQAEEEARRQAEEEARRLAKEEARRQAEEEARRQAEEEARRQAEEEARRQAEEEARRQAEEEARRQAEEEARRQAEEEARRQAEEEARRQAEEEARRQAEEEARRQAEEEARRQAEEEARHLEEQRRIAELEEHVRQLEEENNYLQDKSQEDTDYSEESDMYNQANVAKIKVIGVGGAGSNAVNRMIELGVDTAEFVAVNTDKQALMLSLCDDSNKIQIGASVTKGLGAGADPTVGEQSAEESKKAIESVVSGVDLLFIAAGMGGGTGTGAAPIVAKIAKEAGCVTVAVVTRPFHFEGKKREQNARKGISNLAKYVDTIIIIPNDRLLEALPADTPFVDALKYADDTLRQGICGIADLIATPSLINLDFADVRTILKNQGLAHMGVGRAKGENRVIEAVRQAVASPLLETTIEGAHGIILNVTGGKDLSMLQVKEAADRVQEIIDPTANIIFGMNVNPELQEEIIITIIATGFDKKVDDEQPDTVQRTPSFISAAQRPASSNEAPEEFMSVNRVQFEQRSSIGGERNVDMNRNSSQSRPYEPTLPGKYGYNRQEVPQEAVAEVPERVNPDEEPTETNVKNEKNDLPSFVRRLFGRK